MSETYRVIVEKNGEEIVSHEVRLEEWDKDMSIAFGVFDDKGEVDRSITVSAHFLHWTLVDKLRE